MRTALRVLLAAASILLAVALNGCIYSIWKTDKAAGRNGGFEIVESGLPVNWYFSKGPVRNGNMEISIDAAEPTEGKQALRIIVHRVETGGGKHQRPHFFSSQQAKAGASHTVSFWLKNQGCEIRLGIRNEGKDPLFGPSKVVKQDLAAHPPIVERLGPKETGTNVWRQFEYIYAVPETDGSIRFELDIYRPCTLWIDDVRMEELHTD